MANNVDLNIVSGGETNLELSKLLQEIDVLMTAENQTIINNYDKQKNIDQFLFKYSVNEQIVASTVKSNIYANCYVPEGYSIHVSVRFIPGDNKDIMFIEIYIRYKGIHKEKLVYNF